MDKKTFANFKFKPSDVIEGLNRYFALSKANSYLRVPLEIRNGVCYNNPDCRKDIIFAYYAPDNTRREGYMCWKHYLICDPDEAAGVAINWLREEHDIFYTPGMEAPLKDFDDMIPISRVREALGIAEDSDIFECIKKLREDNNLLEELHASHISQLGEYAELASDLGIGSGDAENLRKEFHRIKKERDFLAFKCGRLKMQANAHYGISCGYSSNETLQEFRDRVCETLDIPRNYRDDNIIHEIRQICDRYNELEDLRSDICGLLDIESMTGTPTQNDKKIVDAVEDLLCDYEDNEKELKAEIEDRKELIKFRDDVAEAIGMDKTATNVILNKVRSIYDSNGVLQDAVLDLNRQVTELRDENQKVRSEWFEQNRLRQQWHVRYESEHERANGVQKALDQSRDACRVKDMSLETLKKQYQKVYGNLETAECAINGLKSKIREMREMRHETDGFKETLNSGEEDNVGTADTDD